MQISLTDLKAKIIESLKLQDISPDQIADDAPLFGTGLGLDSIDALELVVMLEASSVPRCIQSILVLCPASP